MEGVVPMERFVVIARHGDSRLHYIRPRPRALPRELLKLSRDNVTGQSQSQNSKLNLKLMVGDGRNQKV